MSRRLRWVLGCALCVLAIGCFLVLRVPKQKIPHAKHRLLLITGCSRSGTNYMSKLLIEPGLDVQHERLGKQGVTSWCMCVDADPVPFGKSMKGVELDHIFHQVRHPLKVIASVYVSEPPASFAFFSENIPEIIEEDTHLVKAAKYWYYWNLHAEEKAEWHYRIEEIDDVFGEMSQRLQVSLDQAALQKVSRSTNHRQTMELTWDRLRAELSEDLFLKIQQMAARMGIPLRMECDKCEELSVCHTPVIKVN